MTVYCRALTATTLSFVVLVACHLNATAKDPDLGQPYGAAGGQTAALAQGQDRLPAIAQAQPAPVSRDAGTGSNAIDTPSSQPGAATPEEEPAPIWQRDTLTGDWGGLRTKIQDVGVKFGLQEQSELWANGTGGLRRGVVYNGLTTGSVSFDLEKLVGWQGATFFVNAYQIHGRGPSGNLVGNSQIVSNIEATDDTKLYQLWLEQQLLNGRLTIRIGQEGANDQMMITQYGALFLNSSFGFPGLPAADLPSGGPNYPIAAPFVRAQLQATNEITLVGAVFNGDPAPPGIGDPQLRDRGGDAFRLNDHVLAFSEFWYAVNQDEGATGLPATYKLGAWYRFGPFSRPVARHNWAFTRQSNEHRYATRAFNRVRGVWHRRSDGLEEAGHKGPWHWRLPAGHGCACGFQRQQSVR